MIDSVCKALKEKLSLLPYVDKVAGLTRTAVSFLEESVGDHKIVINEKRFPVAVGVSGMQCFAKGRYGNLCPDSRNASVFYFDMVEDARITMVNGMYETRAVVKLVCWFNLPKLGIVQSYSPDTILYELIKIIEGSQSVVDASFNGIKAETTVIGYQRDPSVFTKYSYDKAVIENMLLYPYDYYGIDIAIKVTAGKGCNTLFVPSTPIKCIDLETNTND